MKSTTRRVITFFCAAFVALVILTTNSNVAFAQKQLKFYAPYPADYSAPRK